MEGPVGGWERGATDGHPSFLLNIGVARGGRGGRIATCVCMHGVTVVGEIARAVVARIQGTGYVALRYRRSRRYRETPGRNRGWR